VNRAHFRFLGVPIRVEPLFLVIAALMGYQLRPLWLVFVWILIVFVNVLVHEMGHALAFRFAGQRSAVVLHAFGGFTVPTGGGRRQMSKTMSIVVSLSGVGAQLLLIYLPARILWESDWLASQPFWHPTLAPQFSWIPILHYTMFVSLWWSVLNLLPIRPFDGGHVAEELLGFERACKLSIGVAAVAALVAAVQFSLFTGIFLAMFAFLNYRELQEGRSTGTFDVDAPEGQRASGRATPGGRGGGAPGGGGAGRGRKKSRTGHLQAVPPIPDSPSGLSLARDPGEIEKQAWNALRDGDGERAAVLLKQAIGARPNPFLAASVALTQGQEGLATDMYEAAYMAEPDGPPNLVPATLLAKAGLAGPLVAMLVDKGPVGVEAAGSLQTHLHYAELFEPAAEVGEQVFAASPKSPAQTAFEVACSWARADRPEEALRWVEAAVDAGFRAPALLDGEPDLAPVRALDGWPAVRSRLSA
jgi:Zn-dependent protease